MINSADFIKRLEQVSEYYGLSAAAFADKIGVQRSSISHLLSRRNKPSLEFVLKVVKSFPEVNLYWLLNGKGAFPSTETENSANILHSQRKKLGFPITSDTKEIDRVIIFYKDGTFASYQESTPE